MRIFKESFEIDYMIIWSLKPHSNTTAPKPEEANFTFLQVLAQYVCFYLKYLVVDNTFKNFTGYFYNLYLNCIAPRGGGNK